MARGTPALIGWLTLMTLILVGLATGVGLWLWTAHTLPNRQVGWRALLPGALLGAVLWLVLSGLFALYTSFSDSYSKTYGTLAGGIVLLLWLNYTSWAVLLGAELDSELERRLS